MMIIADRIEQNIHVWKNIAGQRQNGSRVTRAGVMVTKEEGNQSRAEVR